MKITLNKDFVSIARTIMAEAKTVEQWSEIESEDMFQQGAFVGGFDATEREFCFSFDNGVDEYWFQISLSALEKVCNGELDEIEVWSAE